ncbi:MAG TPA: FHA domain-containing protein [Planctomycetaceae bacterium]|nr:FHA domain-containing protein [Planctomycetaceae bacterium]
MKVRLTIQHEKANVKTVVLHSDALIGRSTECNLRVASGQVSRKHCKLIVRNDRVAVVDLASSNGTILDGEFLEANVETEIPPGGELEIGPVRFIVHYDASSADTQVRKSGAGGSRPLQPAVPKKLVSLNDPSQGERVSWEEEDAIEPDQDSSIGGEKDLSSILEHMELEVDPNQKLKPGGHLEETHYDEPFDPDDTEGEEFRLESPDQFKQPKVAPEDDENFMNFLDKLDE